MEVVLVWTERAPKSEVDELLVLLERYGLKAPAFALGKMRSSAWFL